MSKICDICGRGPSTGQNVSHSNRHTCRRYLLNLVTKRFGSATLKICTRCLRTLKKVKREFEKKDSAKTSSETVA